MFEEARDHLREGTDTAKRRTIGELWERSSSDMGPFVLVGQSINVPATQPQLLERTKL